MVKNKMACAVAALVLAFGASAYFMAPAAVFAEGGESEIQEDAVEVHDGTELYNAMLAGGAIRLADDIDAWYWMYVTNDTTLDLNGHTVSIVNTYNYDPYIWVYSGATLTIKGEGAIEKNYASSDPAVWASDGGKIALEGGTISAANRAVTVSYTDGDAGAEFEMNGGSIVSENDFAIVGWKNAKVTINDGTINSKYSCISGNGNAGDSGAKFYINGGTLASEGWAIYGPQVDGVVEITGGEIDATITGVEVRSGTLTITGGTITTGAGVEYKVEPSGSGTTTYGAAVAVAQHTTKQPINVSISGGTFSAPVAFSEANPQKNPEEDIEKVSATITGGTFNSSGDNSVVVSEDLAGFISGGVYDKPFEADYLAEGYSAYEKPQDVWTVDNAVEVELPDKIVIEKGDSYTLELGEIAAKYIVTGMVENEVASLDGLTISGDAAGDTLLNVALYEMGKGFDQPIPVYVYDVEDKTSNVQVETDANEISESDIDEDAISAIKNELGTKTLAGYYDIRAFVVDGDTVIDEVHEVTPFEVLLDMPDLPELKSGYARRYYLIRYHGGVATTIEAYEKDGKIGFVNGEFSTFAIVYEDIEETPVTPDTPDTPETGTITRQGASAVLSSIVVAMFVGIMTTVISFAYIMNRMKK